jgi:hypothetical protein
MERKKPVLSNKVLEVKMTADISSSSPSLRARTLSFPVVENKVEQQKEEKGKSGREEEDEETDTEA